MPIITVTSDWNDSSYYLPVLKGKIYCCVRKGTESVSFETISNRIGPFDIQQACFVLRQSFRAFPKGTVHLLCVNSEPVKGEKMVAVKYAGHWIVSLDDGRFSLILENQAIEKGQALAYALPDPGNISTFSACDQFAHAVCGILDGSIAGTLPLCTLKRVPGGFPAEMEDRIIGKIVHIDAYGNAISNISSEVFYRGYRRWMSTHEEEPGFRICVRGPYLAFDDICDGYAQVQAGDPVALFNAAGLLEFAVNRGDFSRVEGIEVNTEVMVRFME